MNAHTRKRPLQCGGNQGLMLGNLYVLFSSLSPCHSILLLLLSLSFAFPASSLTFLSLHSSLCLQLRISDEIKEFKLTNYFRCLPFFIPLPCLPTLPPAISDPLSLSATRATYGTSSTLFILPRLPSHSSHRRGLTTVRPYFMSSSHPSTPFLLTPQKMRKQICDTCHTYQLKHGCRRPIGLNTIRSRKRASKLGKLGQLGRVKGGSEKNERQKKRSKKEEFLLFSRGKGNEGGVETIIEGKREKWAKRKASHDLEEEKGAEEEKIEKGAKDTATLEPTPIPILAAGGGIWGNR